jgi:hypothetical protein
MKVECVALTENSLELMDNVQKINMTATHVAVIWGCTYSAPNGGYALATQMPITIKIKNSY